ncbi:uncharacterized protein F5891DRAFT_977514 [Suillus fuscotomentosus]|uniref:Uncharacterized protein n=1 Tax=Suillus fuscotomentosus TaxID=1912939 RepID=A0AAD4HPB2_9AGAM|nr:uncharacterized protein F5891DRAFT_977514 [Suillus fuscotomentosus]KAG1904003.1 hypothetical protein F5891DRAFT_977514 [Suillus fuscotomentosus]
MPPEWTSICNTCSQKFKSYGLVAYQKACKRDALWMQEDHERQNAQAGSNTAPAMHEFTYDPYVNPDEGLPFTVPQEAPDDHVLPPAFQQDDIRTEHHPLPENTIPWEPFASHIDSNFAELILKAKLTKLQMNELIGLIRCTVLEKFSVTNYDSICKMWDVASPCHANFKKKVISVPHRDQEHNFNVWYRLLWDWACDLLKDPCLGLHFMFDAQWLYKYDGQDFVHFFDEPWVANAFWDSQKAYPVIANSPVRICNGEGFGGGRLIGWLPIVEEERQYSRTQSFVNFKNVVWHESFKCLLKSLTLLSKTGFCIKCWDGISAD